MNWITNEAEEQESGKKIKSGESEYRKGRRQKNKIK